MLPQFRDFSLMGWRIFNLVLLADNTTITLPVHTYILLLLFHMAPLEEMHTAMVNRSIRTIKAVRPSHSSDRQNYI
jgi:hypothetical protein